MVRLQETDFAPIEGYPFQNWGMRDGAPFEWIRPLNETAAKRVWRNLPPSQNTGDVLDLAENTDWSIESVRQWLLEHGGDRRQQVIASYGPPWAVVVEWGVLCDYWLNFLWLEGTVRSIEHEWVLWHDEERLHFQKPQMPKA